MKKLTKAQQYRKDTDTPTDLDFIKYVLECAENITASKNMVEKYGMIPPMLQLYKLAHETEVYLEVTKDESR